MEIISYVGFGNEKRSRTAAFKDRIGSVVFHRRDIMKEQNVASRSVPSFRKLIVFIKAHFWIFIVALFCTTVPFTVNNICSYVESFTGPLMLHTEGASELEVLDSVMARFAMDGSVDYDDAGDILDSNGKALVTAETLFRKPVAYRTYKVQPGDTISGITKKFGLTNISTLIAVNDISNVCQLCSGQKLRIPSIDGLLYTVNKGNSIAGLSAKFNVSVEDVLDVNDLSSQIIMIGQQLFIPGAKLGSAQLQQALGTLFMVPLSVQYHISSPFGWRADPFTGTRSFHTGIDMACSVGTPIKAAMSGKIAYVGWSNVFGNYVIINHENGYQTLYGHMSKTLAARGQWVSQGTRIGLVGSTGYSTGPHLHFTVYKNGQLVNPSGLLKLK
jgi:murein DD-endopeptidase MepM/ murein hydrolase activator NlpD